MLFTSWEFILLFLPIAIIIYFVLIRQKFTSASKLWLVFASLSYYAWYDIKYLPLLLASISLNYVFATTLVMTIQKKNSIPFSIHVLQNRLGRKSILVLGIALNLAILGYFKYANFFIYNLNFLSHFQIGSFHIGLPTGLSFFTFIQIAFLVDVYRRKAEEYPLLNYSLFVTFFAYLNSGPIVRHAEMMDQYEGMKDKSLDYRNISIGLSLFLIGFFKKVVMADTLAEYANSGFADPGALTLVTAWITSLSNTLQIYFDFSGYTDMALGVAWMFNIRLPLNFDSPYKARNIRDFWRRWHMTLTRFLIDYVYIPLGGNRSAHLRAFRNIMITFLLCGLWHGASWTFVFWGFLHGIAMVAHRIWERRNIKMSHVLAWFITFNFVNFAWVFFSAKNWGNAINVFKGMAGMNGISPLTKLQNQDIFVLLIFFSVARFAPNSNQMVDGFKPNWRFSILTALLLFICLVHLLAGSHSSKFLYFNF